MFVRFVKQLFVEEPRFGYSYKEPALTRERCFFYLLARVHWLVPCPAPEGLKSVAIAVK